MPTTCRTSYWPHILNMKHAYALKQRIPVEQWIGAGLSDPLAPIIEAYQARPQAGEPGVLRHSKERRRLSQTRNALGQFQKATADYDQAARLIPEIPHVYFNRSLAKAEMGLYREALADLKVALVLARQAGDGEFITRIEEKIKEVGQE